MPIFHAIVLGIVQGLTEFLPISSCGHLLLVPWLFGWNDFADAPSSREGVRRGAAPRHADRRRGVLLAGPGGVRARRACAWCSGASEPVHARGPAGVAARAVVDPAPSSSAASSGTRIDEKLGTRSLIAVSLIVFGLLLRLGRPARRERARVDELRARRDALIVGAAQVLALNPGTSRSGHHHHRRPVPGLHRDSAARISFLMAIPVTAGAVVFKMAKLIGDGIPDGLLAPMIVGHRHVGPVRLAGGVGHAAPGAHTHVPAVRRSTASCWAWLVFGAVGQRAYADM